MDGASTSKYDTCHYRCVLVSTGEVKPYGWQGCPYNMMVSASDQSYSGPITGQVTIDVFI